MDRVLNIDETIFEACLDYNDHVESLQKYLSRNKNPGWSYKRFDDRLEIMFTYDKTSEVTYVRYCSLSELTDEIIDNSDEINFVGEITKNIAREILNEHWKL